MLRLKYIKGENLTILGAAIANTISPELSTEELVLLSDLLGAVGVNLTVIAAQRTALDAARESATDSGSASTEELQRRIAELEGTIR